MCAETGDRSLEHDTLERDGDVSFILIPYLEVVGLEYVVLPTTFSSMIHLSLFCRAGWGRFSGLVGGAYGRCSTATNPTIPVYDFFSYTLQTAADLGVAAHEPIKKWGRSCGLRATPRATAIWAPTVFSRRQA